MSIPISSTSTGMPPSEVTQSAMVSAPTSWAASQIGCPWLYSPVEVAGLLRVKGLAPWLGQADHLRAVAARHFANAVAEETVGKERELFARLDEVGHRRFHAGGAGAGDGDVELVLDGKSVAEQGADLVDHLEEERVEMADHRLPHGLVDAGRDHAGSGSEEKALRRLERS